MALVQWCSGMILYSLSIGSGASQGVLSGFKAAVIHEKPLLGCAIARDHKVV